MDEQSLGLTIRLFLRDLFGSRVATILDEALLRERESCELRLREKDSVIAHLREQNSAYASKLDRYELVLLPLTSPAAPLFKPRPSLDTLEPIIERPGSVLSTLQADYDRQQEAVEKAAAARNKENS